MKTKLVLKDEAGLVEHASVSVDIEVVQDYHLVERNGHIYYFYGKVNGGENAYIFCECKPALHLAP